MSKHRSLPDPPQQQQRRQKPKFELEHIHLDELLNAAGMSGYLGVLDPPSSAPHLEVLAKEMLDEMQSSGLPLNERYQAATISPAPTQPETSTPDKGIPETGTPTTSITTPIPGIPETGTPASTTPTETAQHNSTTPDTGIPETGTPTFKTIPVAPRRLIRQAQLVQDGHSLGEQLIYQTLWDQAQPHSPDARIITIGYRTLSAYSNLTVNNCKANLLSLARKLSIEEVVTHTATQGKTYLVFSFAAILRRRRSAGLTHYIKHRGVTFVDPITGVELSLSGIPDSGTPFSEEGIPVSGQKGTPVSAPLSIEQLERQDDSAPEASSSLLRSALESIVTLVDDAAVRQLHTACRQAAPTATEDDIAWLIRTKASLVNSRHLRNPLGFLLVAVPRCLEGQGLASLRRYRQVELPVADESQEAGAWRREMQRVLDNPLSAEEDRHFATRLLAGEMAEPVPAT